MISKIAQKIVDALCVASIVNEEDRELYTYGFFVLVSRIFFFVVTIIWGIAFDILRESILFYFVFTIIRSYAGGVHASKEIICLILTSLSIFACIAIIWLQIHFRMMICPIILLVVSSIIVFLLCPLDTGEKQIEDSDRRKYKGISCVLVAAILVASFWSLHLGMMWMLYLCAVALGLESVLLILGKIKRRI